MNNKELANELIVRYAGIPEPMRGMIREAAARLLQMVPDETFMPGLQEAKWLRQLADKWPVIEEPKDDADQMSTTIHDTCISAANRLEQMAETIAYARTIQAEGVRLTAELEKVKAERDASLADLNEVRPCVLCAYRPSPRKCRTCLGEGWVWRGAKDNNVPTKKENDHDPTDN